MFIHDWLPKFDLHRIDSDHGRRYITPEGMSYESVTTFLSKFNHASIDEWKQAVGEKEASRIADRAATRGTSIHNILETHLTNQPVIIPRTDLLVMSIAKPFLKLMDGRVNNIRAIEYQLYSDNLRLAGTVDCVAEWDGVLSIIDFKTSSKLKSKYEIENYFLQTTIYSLMVEERYGIRVPNIVILIGVEFMDEVQVFVEQRQNYVNTLIKLIKEHRNVGA